MWYKHGMTDDVVFLQAVEQGNINGVAYVWVSVNYLGGERLCCYVRDGEGWRYYTGEPEPEWSTAMKPSAPVMMTCFILFLLQKSLDLAIHARGHIAAVAPAFAPLHHHLHGPAQIPAGLPAEDGLELRAVELQEIGLVGAVIGHRLPLHALAPVADEEIHQRAGLEAVPVIGTDVVPAAVTGGVLVLLGGDHHVGVQGLQHMLVGPGGIGVADDDLLALCAGNEVLLLLLFSAETVDGPCAQGGGSGKDNAGGSAALCQLFESQNVCYVACACAVILFGIGQTLQTHFHHLLSI